MVGTSLIWQPVEGRHSRLVFVYFEQRSDITIKNEQPGKRPRLILFDPKYKPDGDHEGAKGGPPRTKKVDIDKMRVDCEAIRTSSGQPVVEIAAILYLGPIVHYIYGLHAVEADPLLSVSLSDYLKSTPQRLVSQAGRHRSAFTAGYSVMSSFEADLNLRNGTPKGPCLRGYRLAPYCHVLKAPASRVGLGNVVDKH